MAQFFYEGRDRTGKQRKGKVTSNNRREAMLKLKEQGIAVVNIRELEVGFLQQETTWRTIKYFLMITLAIKARVIY